MDIESEVHHEVESTVKRRLDTVSPSERKVLQRKMSKVKQVRIERGAQVVARRELSKLGERLGKPEISAALEATNDPKMLKLAAALINPKYVDYSLAKLCGKMDIKFEEFVDAWRTYKLGEAISVMVQHAPQVFEDVAIDSKSRKAKCVACEGKGKILDTEDQCRICDGQGFIREAGDKDSRGILFEALGLIKSKAPFAANQINIGIPSLEQTMKQAQTIFEVKKLRGSNAEDSD